MNDQFLMDLMGDWTEREETPAAPVPVLEAQQRQEMYEQQFAQDSSPENICAPAPAATNNEQFPILYHKGKGGALYQWRVWTDGATIYSEHGITGGQKQIATKIATPKNEGRSNATTAEAQALTEAKAMWTYKVERKYCEDINKTEDTVFLPMLAHSYDPSYSQAFTITKGGKKKENKKALSWPVDVQPKLDGVRCIAYWDETGVHLMSRQGLEWVVPTHINKQLELILPKDAILDGELYTHGVPFQELTRWVKKFRPEKTPLLEYHVYDVPQWQSADDLPWTDRRLALQAFSGLITDETPNIKTLTTNAADDHDHVWELQKLYVREGYEGAIIRNRPGKYLWGAHRSHDLLKVKSFLDDEFVVVGHEKEVKSGTDSEGEFSYECVVWVCATSEGKKFNCRPKGTLLSRQELLAEADKYHGKKLTVRFFEMTDDNIPRFPVGVGFRPDEDLP